MISVPPHKRASLGEINQTFLIALISIAALVILSLLLLFTDVFVGKAIGTASGTTVHFLPLQVDASGKVTLSIEITPGEEVNAVYFELASSPNYVLCTAAADVRVTDPTGWRFTEANCISRVFQYSTATIDPGTGSTASTFLAAGRTVTFTLSPVAALPIGTETTLTLQNVHVLETDDGDNLVTGGTQSQRYTRSAVGAGRGAIREICANALDDDGDGLVDAADTVDCPAARELCTNGRDDDGDGLVDGADSDCRPPGTVQEICGNSIDDDRDGQVDEAPCPSAQQTQQQTGELCYNGQDDDGDGLIDRDDPSCPEYREPEKAKKSGGSLTCVRKWQCEDWSSCLGNVQTRNCFDLNKCEATKKVGTKEYPVTIVDKAPPERTRSCVAAIVPRQTVQQPAQPPVVQQPLPLRQPVQPPVVTPSFLQRYRTSLVAGAVLLVALALVFSLVHFLRKPRGQYNYDELKEWVGKERYLGASDEEMKQLLQQNTGWTKEEIEQALQK